MQVTDILTHKNKSIIKKKNNKDFLSIIIGFVISSCILLILWLLLSIFFKEWIFLVGFAIAWFFSLIIYCLRVSVTKFIFQKDVHKHQSVVYSLLGFLANLACFTASTILGIFSDPWMGSGNHDGLISNVVTFSVYYIAFIIIYIVISYRK